MANSSQARKRARQSETRRRQNASQRSAMRTALKKAIAAVKSGDYETATTAYNAAVPILDSAVTHGIIHKNKAARHKSRLNTKIKALKASSSTA
ncbi:MAG: 30S ribosomal protein S20 [Proteobacteria bacterium]|nr:30S ribosomal protein S20 [Pseudomonadota bacterium]